MKTFFHFQGANEIFFLKLIFNQQTEKKVRWSSPQKKERQLFPSSKAILKTICRKLCLVSVTILEALDSRYHAILIHWSCIASTCAFYILESLNVFESLNDFHNGYSSKYMKSNEGKLVQISTTLYDSLKISNLTHG